MMASCVFTAGAPSAPKRRTDPPYAETRHMAACVATADALRFESSDRSGLRSAFSVISRYGGCAFGLSALRGACTNSLRRADKGEARIRRYPT